MLLKVRIPVSFQNNYVKSADNIIVKINLQEILILKKEESLNKLCDANCFP